MRSSDIIFVLDASGSMSSMGREPVDSLNQFIKDQRRNDGSTFTLVTFNTTSTIVMNNVPLYGDKCLCLHPSQYVPGGLTALYDALGETIQNKLSSTRNRNVIMVILTDGEENSSHEYKRADIQKLIEKAKSKYDWQFIYLGANQDAFKVGSSMGCSVNANYEYTTSGLNNIVNMCSAAVSNSKSTGKKIKTI